MKAIVLSAALVVSGLIGPQVLAEDALKDMPKPTKAHKWLKKFAGQWELRTEVYMPGQEKPLVSEGTERVESLGGFWVMGHIKATMMGQDFKGKMTVGYDAEKKKYVGTWIDSMSSQQWNYEGVLEDGKLVLMTHGFCPIKGKACDLKDVIEFSEDGKSRTFISYYKDDDGEWKIGMKGTAKKVPAKKKAKEG